MITKMLENGNKVVFDIEKINEQILITGISIIEKGKRKSTPLYQSYSSRVSYIEKTNLIKSLFDLKTDTELNKLLNSLKDDFIKQKIQELESLSINFWG